MSSPHLLYVCLFIFVEEDAQNRHVLVIFDNQCILTLCRTSRIFLFSDGVLLLSDDLLLLSDDILKDLQRSRVCPAQNSVIQWTSETPHQGSWGVRKHDMSQMLIEVVEPPLFVELLLCINCTFLPTVLQMPFRVLVNVAILWSGPPPQPLRPALQLYSSQRR
jgi:hypothetical protein